MRLNKSYTIPAAIILLLIILRIALPFIVKDYVNKVLDDMPDYTGHVEDIELHIYRGAYVIKGLVLQVEESEQKKPLLEIPETDLSVEWDAIWNGALVGEVIMNNPQLSFVATQQQPSPSEETPTEEKEHWSETLKNLMPLTVNRFEIVSGKIAYIDSHSQPKVNVHLDSLHLVATNLTNIGKTAEKLPSSLKASGRTVGGGILEVEGSLNVLKEIPDLDIDLSLTNVHLPSLNDFIEAYGKLDIESGTFSLYTEIKMMNGTLDGYMKPFFENLKVLNWKQDKKEDGFFRALWEAVAGLVSEGVENQKRDQIATQVPIQGNINQPDTETWETVLNILKHAFIEAFNKGIEGKVGQEPE